MWTSLYDANGNPVMEFDIIKTNPLAFYIIYNYRLFSVAVNRGRYVRNSVSLQIEDKIDNLIPWWNKTKRFTLGKIENMEVLREDVISYEKRQAVIGSIQLSSLQ